MTEGETWQIPVGSDVTTALFEPATNGADEVLFVCAHGAGGHMRDLSMEAVTQALRGIGIGVVRFNFIYREQGSKRPDPMPRLQACISAVVEHARTTLAPRRLLIGGRSMGGRAASMLAADGSCCDGLLLLAYPLHPAGKPEKLRNAHLAAIPVHTLCFNGTRDALCTREIMDRIVAPLVPRWRMHWLEGADHSFRVLRSSGRTNAEVLDEVSKVTRQWIEDTK